jgi:alpha-beta hydrolase superfamily lysophospholipase
MTPSTDFHVDGRLGSIAVRRWSPPAADLVVVIAHGYAEHSGRYDHVARRLVDEGAVVYAPDHHAHGRSGGKRGHFDDLDVLVDDLGTVVTHARGEHPGLPVALVGHSMGGIVATRFAQSGGAAELTALILSGPPIGGNPALEGLLALDPIPEVPIDPGMLSRDPAVGEDYAADELVYHGPFVRSTLRALFDAIAAVQSGPGLGELPLLWLQGELDPLAPLALTRPVVEDLRGEVYSEHVYAEARHEVFNETNRQAVLDDLVAFLDRVLGAAAPTSRLKRQAG